MERITEKKNLLIRDAQFRDYELFAEWEIDPEVTRFLSFDEDRSFEDVVNEAIRDRNDPTKMDLTIVDRATDKPIGRVIVTRIDRHSDSLDITKLYIGDLEMRGNGCGEDVMRNLLEYFFTFMHMERVSLDYYTGNKAAQNLYEKLGFVNEGIARNATKKNGRYYDLNLMSMLGYYGEPVRKKAQSLLSAGLYNLTGTDIHSYDTLQDALSDKSLTSKQVAAISQIRWR